MASVHGGVHVTLARSPLADCGDGAVPWGYELWHVLLSYTQSLRGMLSMGATIAQVGLVIMLPPCSLSLNDTYE